MDLVLWAFRILLGKEKCLLMKTLPGRMGPWLPKKSNRYSKIGAVRPGVVHWVWALKAPSGNQRTNERGFVEEHTVRSLAGPNPMGRQGEQRRRQAQSWARRGPDGETRMERQPRTKEELRVPKERTETEAPRYIENGHFHPSICPPNKYSLSVFYLPDVLNPGIPGLDTTETFLW